MDKIDFDEWVGNNNVDRSTVVKNYGKGWWEYIGFIRVIASKIDAKVYVVSTYEMGTPPPQEMLLLPVILLETKKHDFFIKESFAYGGFFDEWLVSVVCKEGSIDKEVGRHINKLKTDGESVKNGYRKGFIDEVVAGFKETDLLFKSCSENDSRFTGTVLDKYDLVCLINVIIKAH
jgi:hypothetical protein